MWKIILQDLRALLAKVEQIAETAGREIWHIVQQVFSAEEAIIMTQLYNMLKSDAIDLQNTQPGISSKDAESVLKKNAEIALLGLGASLAYTAVITVIGTVLHDLSFGDTQGNQGVVTTGA